MFSVKFKLISICLLIGLIYADPPNWDLDGDGVLDNFNDYENNGSITVMVSSDGINSFADTSDMIAAFVNDEQRGVGLTNLVPFGPFAGTYQFQMMIYSNVAEGEILTFQYYDSSTEIIYILNDTLEFIINMTEGNVTNPLIFTFDEIDNGDESQDDDFISNGTPDWDLDGDGVLDNYNDYENNGSITALVTTDGVSSFSGPGDMISCFVNDEIRGVGLTNLVPFGPYEGTYQFQMMIYSNVAEGEILNFQYYNQAYDAVFNLSETLDFEINMTVGNVVNPIIFSFNPGELEDLIYGCTDISACNYDETANADDGTCDYPEDYFDCEGSCLSDVDNDEVCDELEILGCTNPLALNYDSNATEDDNSCLILGCTDSVACNYDPGATLDNSGCEYPQENFDCNGNCLYELDCNGICGGDAEVDECNECGGLDFDGNGLCNPVCPENFVLNPQFPNVGDDNVCVPELFIFNISTLSAGYLFYEVTIGGNPISNNDWVGAFNGDICVGSQIWNTQNCSNNICSISVMGSDNDGFTTGYMISGQIPQFKIYDSSENIYYDAYVTEEIEWQNFGFADILLLSTQTQGCTDQFACNFDEFALEDNGTCEYDSCSGCTNEDALNFDQTALIDDGSCVFDYDLPPTLFEFNQSTQQAFYFFQLVSVDNIELESNDWVAAFNNGICVGSKKWDTSLCGEGICDLPVMGDDNEEYSQGYMLEGQIPTFKIYDYSSQTFYDAVASNDFEWQNNGTYVVDLLNVQRDCENVLGGNSFIDNCGNCVSFGSEPDAFEDDCGVCYGDNNDQDCAGVCFGQSLIDDCGICSLPNEFNSTLDDCGICDGDNSTCSGCSDPNALNFDDFATIDDGTCIYSTPVSIELNSGANLISFYALSENIEFQNFVSPLLENITGVITEGSSSILFENQWLGSILSMDISNGYWFIMEDSDVLEFDGVPIDSNFEYSLHEGANLISFPSSESYLLDDVIPEVLDGIIYGIISEGQSAYYLDGNWVGLEYLEGGKGYWFKTFDDVSFSFDFENSVEIAFNRQSQENISLLGYDILQSSEQAFYFIDEVKGASLGDWIIAYCNENVVGTKKWNGEITDVAVMGYMSKEFDFSKGYCKNGDIPDLILFKSKTGQEISLYGDINPWYSNNIYYVGTLSTNNSEIPNHFGLNNIYPNPFNPITTIEFFVPNNMLFDLSIYNIQGRIIENIFSNHLGTGSQSFSYNAKELSSGIYFIQLKTSSFTDYSKIILIK